MDAGCHDGDAARDGVLWSSSSTPTAVTVKRSRTPEGRAGRIDISAGTAMPCMRA